MKAVRLERFGGPDVLSYQDVPVPQLGEGQVLVRVQAIGVNYGDTVVRAGGAPIALDLPLILGSEAAGVVEQLGPGVSNLAVGDRVAAPIFVAGRLGGAYAELVVVDANVLVRLPGALSLEAAAALLLQGLTALWLLEHVPIVHRTVLIHAAAGGVGSLLMQLARQKGAAQIIATASTLAKLALVQRLGADIVVNYTEPDWLDRVRAATGKRGPDVIYDQVGGEIRRQSLELLAPRGTLAIYGWASTSSVGTLDEAQLMGLYLKNQFVTAFSGWSLFAEPGLLERSYAELFDLVIAGSLDVQIGMRYPLAEAAEAHRALAARETTGKILLIP